MYCCKDIQIDIIVLFNYCRQKSTARPGEEGSGAAPARLELAQVKPDISMYTVLVKEEGKLRLSCIIATKNKTDNKSIRSFSGLSDKAGLFTIYFTIWGKHLV